MEGEPPKDLGQLEPRPHGGRDCCVSEEESKLETLVKREGVEQWRWEAEEGSFLGPD